MRFKKISLRNEGCISYDNAIMGDSIWWEARYIPLNQYHLPPLEKHLLYHPVISCLPSYHLLYHLANLLLTLSTKWIIFQYCYPYRPMNFVSYKNRYSITNVTTYVSYLRLELMNYSLNLSLTIPIPMEATSI